MVQHEKTQALRQTVLDLASAVANPAVGDETFDRYLDWVSRFHKYSFGNIGLILSQFPAATYVAGYTTWKQQGRQVRGGEKGIAILVPMRTKPITELDPQTNEEQALPGRVYFGVGYVFDVSQTHGKDAVPNFRADLGGNSGVLLRAGAVFAETQGIEVCLHTLFGSTNGYSELGRVVLNSARPAGILAQVLLHELGHELLHDGNGRKTLPHALIEGEAEAVAVVVLRHFGFDTACNGAAYIRSHGADSKAILDSLDRITTTARTIIDGVNQALSNLTAEQQYEQAEMQA